MASFIVGFLAGCVLMAALIFFASYVIENWAFRKFWGPP
jgi:hypothetical protein